MCDDHGIMHSKYSCHMIGHCASGLVISWSVIASANCFGLNRQVESRVGCVVRRIGGEGRMSSNGRCLGDFDMFDVMS